MPQTISRGMDKHQTPTNPTFQPFDLEDDADLSSDCPQVPECCSINQGRSHEDETRLSIFPFSKFAKRNHNLV